MKKFEALSNLPFGIKKGDIIFENGSVITNEKGYVVPIIPSKEKDFFKEVIELKGKFEKETVVFLKTVTDRKEYVKSGLGRNYFKVPAWTALILVDHFEKSKKLYAIINFNGRNYEVLESEISEYKEYHFINSKGEIHKALIGREAGADLFRLKSKNYFASKEDARKELDKIMGVEVSLKPKKVISKARVKTNA
jgi:hypothetical protein